MGPVNNANNASNAPCVPYAEELYTDGGVIGASRSEVGGTWAFLRTRHVPASACEEAGEVEIARASGFLSPGQVGESTVTNNNAELVALCAGILSLPDGWEGRINADSNVALGWVFRGWKTDSIPGGLLPYLGKAKAKLRRIRAAYRLLDGHPTKDQLARGYGKRGNPVSRFNQACDQECNRVKGEYLVATPAGK